MALPVLWLHVGAGKTGSSAIQSALAINRPVLLDRGVYYPPHKTDTAALAGQITSGNAGALAAFVCDRDADKYIHDRARRTINRPFAGHSDVPATVFSSELMAQAPHAKRLEELAGFAAAAGRTVKVIYYVRHLLNHAVSLYNDLIKGGDIIELHDYLRGYRPEFTTIAPYEAVFGAANIVVKIYDEDQDDVFGGFVPPLGVTAEGLERPRTINRGLTAAEAVTLKQASRAFGIGGDPERKLSFRRAARLVTEPIERPAEPIVIEPGELATVRANNAEILDHFNNTYFGGAERLKVGSADVVVAARSAPASVDRDLLERMESELRKAE